MEMKFFANSVLLLLAALELFVGSECYYYNYKPSLNNNNYFWNSKGTGPQNKDKQTKNCNTSNICNCQDYPCDNRIARYNLETCFKSIFYSQTFIDNYDIMSTCEINGVLRDYTAFWKQECANCTWVKLPDVRRRYRRSTNTISVSDDSRSEGVNNRRISNRRKTNVKRRPRQTDENWPCCKTIKEVFVPMTVEYNGQEYQVSKLNDNFYQVFTAGFCSSNGASCVDGRTCVEVLDHPTRVLVNDINTNDLLYIPVNWPRFCRCANVGN